MLSPLEGKRFFDDGLRRISFLVLLIGLAVFLGLSFHGHGDAEDHSGDCSVCAAVINSHALPAIVIALTFCFLVIVSSFRVVCVHPKSATIRRQDSRAPPFSV